MDGHHSDEEEAQSDEGKTREHVGRDLHSGMKACIFTCVYVSLTSLFILECIYIYICLSVLSTCNKDVKRRSCFLNVRMCVSERDFYRVGCGVSEGVCGASQVRTLLSTPYAPHTPAHWARDMRFISGVSEVTPEGGWGRPPVSHSPGRPRQVTLLIIRGQECREEVPKMCERLV